MIAEECHCNSRDDTFLINVSYILADEGNCTSLVNMQKGAIGEIDKWEDPFWVKIIYK